VANETSRLPDHLEAAITTRHEHESADQPPLWLVWINRKDGDGWFLHSVCNTERNVRYNVECYGSENAGLIVERIPANHAFASSIEQELREANHRIAAKSYHAIHGYRRAGD
jgi:hypothetical protein